MMALIVIRPEPGCTATLAAARAIGLEAQGFALFLVEPRGWQVPEPADFDALLVGSANVFRHGGAGLAALRHLPVHAVGETTADAARTAGFVVASLGHGGLQMMLDSIAPGTRLLRLCGEQRVPLELPPGILIEEHVVYASATQAMSSALADMLQTGALVLLHSAEAARHFGAECDRLGRPRARITLAALGARIAAAAGPGWAGVESADEPSDAALLALASRMCQDASQ